jgi:hypothetical protein
MMIMVLLVSHGMVAAAMDITGKAMITFLGILRVLKDSLAVVVLNLISIVKDKTRVKVERKKLQKRFTMKQCFQTVM